MLKNDSRPVPQDDVLFTKLESGESVLLGIDSKMYYSLNEVGSRIWQLLSDSKTIGEIADQLQQEYDVTSDHATQSVIELVENLLSEKLVSLP